MKPGFVKGPKRLIYPEKTRLKPTDQIIQMKLKPSESFCSNCRSFFIITIVAIFNLRLQFVVAMLAVCFKKSSEF